MPGKEQWKCSRRKNLEWPYVFNCLLYTFHVKYFTLKNRSQFLTMLINTALLTAIAETTVWRKRFLLCISKSVNALRYAEWHKSFGTWCFLLNFVNPHPTTVSWLLLKFVSPINGSIQDLEKLLYERITFTHYYLPYLVLLLWVSLIFYNFRPL